jgi:hypothetical protein
VIESEVARLLAELAERIERLPVAADATIELDLRVHDRPGVLRFAPSPSRPGKQIIELSITSESGLSTSSQWLDTGASADLVAYLRKPETIAETIATAEELARSLSNHRLA